MAATQICYLIAFIFFLLAGLGVSRPPLSWRDFGFAFLVLGLLLPGLL